MGQPSMPEIRESTQLLYRKLTTLSSWDDIRKVVGQIGYLRGKNVCSCLRQSPAVAALPVAIGVGVPHAVVLIIVSVIVTGLVSVIGRYLLLYARNRRARSIAEIRKAAIEGKIAVADAEKLIRADMPSDADPQELEGGDTTGEESGLGGGAQSCDGVETEQEAARAEQVNDAVDKILDALRINGYKPPSRVEDVEVGGGGPVPEQTPAQPDDTTNAGSKDPGRNA